MHIEKPADYFQAIAAHPWEPLLVHDVGTWQFEIDGAGTWSIAVDHGALRVAPGPAPAATTRFRLSEPAFVRLARGDGHENIMTALLRGAVHELHGDISFAQKVQALLPAHDIEIRP